MREQVLKTDWIGASILLLPIPLYEIYRTAYPGIDDYHFYNIIFLVQKWAGKTFNYYNHKQRRE